MWSGAERLIRWSKRATCPETVRWPKLFLDTGVIVDEGENGLHGAG